MKSILILLFLIPQFLLAKGQEVKGQPVPPATLTAAEAIAIITPILDEVLNGTRYVLNEGCSGISYVSNASMLDAIVDSKNYYILLSDQNVGGIDYLESTCTTKKYSSSDSISCVARTLNVSDRSKSFYFTFKYGEVGGNKTLFTCPF